MCSKCFREKAALSKKRKEPEDTPIIENAAKQLKLEVAPEVPATVDKEQILDAAPSTQQESLKTEEKIETPSPKAPSKCGKCNKKVGLTAIKCKCGDVFCSAHRYADQHN